MKRWALVTDGKVTNLTELEDGVELDFGDTILGVPLDDDQVVDVGYLYKDGVFSAPQPTEEEIAFMRQQAIAFNVSMKSLKMSEASQRISVLQDAVDLEMASEEEAAALPLWKKYRVLLSRIDANTPDTVTWPEKPAALPPGNVNK